jgi:hypothetical protein
MKKRFLFRFFDRLEDNIRGFLSKIPIVYSLIGGVSIVLFWRGVWHSADLVVPYLFANTPDEVYNLATILDAPVSILIAFILLLSTGLMVSHFIGNEIIISGIRHEKKLEEKEVEEIESEEYILHTLANDVKKIKNDLELIKEKINK